MEVAWTTALATPRSGHAAFVAVVVPGVAVKPPTLFVNKAQLAGERHARLTWGAAQAGVAAGVLDAVAEGAIDPEDVANLLLIAAVWVDPDAAEEEVVYTNNRAATRGALRAGRSSEPGLDQILNLRDSPQNPFFRTDR